MFCACVCVCVCVCLFLLLTLAPVATVGVQVVGVQTRRLLKPFQNFPDVHDLKLARVNTVRATRPLYLKMYSLKTFSSSFFTVFMTHTEERALCFHTCVNLWITFKELQNKPKQPSWSFLLALVPMTQMPLTSRALFVLLAVCSAF